MDPWIHGSVGSMNPWNLHLAIPIVNHTSDLQLYCKASLIINMCLLLQWNVVVSPCLEMWRAAVCSTWLQETFGNLPSFHTLKSLLNSRCRCMKLLDIATRHLTAPSSLHSYRTIYNFFVHCKAHHSYKY